MARVCVEGGVYLVLFGGQGSGASIIYATAELAIEHAKRQTPKDAVVSDCTEDDWWPVLYYAKWGDDQYVAVQNKRINA